MSSLSDLFSSVEASAEIGIGESLVEFRGIRLGFFESELGTIAVGQDDGAVCWLSFCDSDADAVLNVVRSRLKTDVEIGESGEFERVFLELREYFAGTRREFDIPLKLKGTAFQRKVWETLRTIPYGQSISYSGLAERVGVQNGQRAVGKANGDNPVSIFVPCHRVVRADGDLCGYAWGLWRKQRLLGLESGQSGLF